MASQRDVMPDVCDLRCSRGMASCVLERDVALAYLRVRIAPCIALNFFVRRSYLGESMNRMAVYKAGVRRNTITGGAESSFRIIVVGTITGKW